MATPASIDDYIATAPDHVRPILEQVRSTIREALPRSSEAISYRMPTIVMDGRRVIHFAAWKNHLAVYPIPSGDDDLLTDLKPYAGDKGTLRFPLDRPIPYPLIGRVASALASEAID